MPPRGIKAPAGVTDDATSEWRRCPAQPVTFSIDTTNHPLHPDKPDPLTAMQNFPCAVGVVTAQLWRISALAGRQGRLRACMIFLQRYNAKQRITLVTTSIIKSDAVPALRAGAGALFSGGWGAEVADLLGLGLGVCLIL